jgi:hypothetical protein
MHLEGDIQILLPQNQLFIHHGPEKQPPLRARGLSHHWKNGDRKVLKSGTTTGETTRFMSLTIKLKTLGETSKIKLNVTAII